ncbi:signal peptidase II [Candidatus Woesearchaeota archaeon]|nr:signal peptidase II [Candidatus Woesearchaeota archaeon]
MKKKINRAKKQVTKDYSRIVRNKYIYFFIIAALTTVLDQLIKVNILPLEIGVKHALFSPYLFITHVNNYGASFGIFQHQTLPLIAFSFFVIGVILYYLQLIPQRYIAFVSLIMGGTISNLVDRIAYGFVVDYLDIVIWPTFNVADMAITIGAIGTIWHLMREKE